MNHNPKSSVVIAKKEEPLPVETKKPVNENILMVDKLLAEVGQQLPNDDRAKLLKYMYTTPRDQINVASI